MEEKDLPMVLFWRNSERIRASMFSDHRISWEEHYSWFNSLKDNKSVYQIFELNNRAVGISDFTAVDEFSNRAHWGFYLGETGLPRSTGLLMGWLSMEFAFETMRIRKLCSSVLKNNTVSINYHKKLGFVKEGIFKQHVRKDNRFEDVVNFALFIAEWENKKLEIQQLLKE